MGCGTNVTRRDTDERGQTYQNKRNGLQKPGWVKAKETGSDSRHPWGGEEINREAGARKRQREHHRESPRLKSGEKETNTETHNPPQPGPTCSVAEAFQQGRESTLLEIPGRPRTALQCSGPYRGHIKATSGNGRRGLA